MESNLLALKPGTKLKDYVIESVLGQGGFGVVYKAKHTRLHEPVVIKEFLPSELAGRVGNSVHSHDDTREGLFKDCLERFVLEGQTLVKLKHNNVVRCRDLFNENGTEYLVMDFEDGLPLDELLKSAETGGHQYTQEQLLHVLIPLAEGIAYIHQQGVLHRDIKPGNVFIRRKGDEPVLIDFGAAKQNFAEVSQSQAPYTEFYAPMEQIEGDPGVLAKPTIDIHAFGALMYRMVVGKTGPSAGKRALAFVTEQKDSLVPAQRAAKGKFSDELLALIDRCLAFKDSDRPQTMEEVIYQLKAIQAGESIAADAAERVDSAEKPVQQHSHSKSTVGISREKHVKENSSSQIMPYRRHDSKKLIATLLIVLVTALGGFWGYVKYQEVLKEKELEQLEADAKALKRIKLEVGQLHHQLVTQANNIKSSIAEQYVPLSKTDIFESALMKANDLKAFETLKSELLVQQQLVRDILDYAEEKQAAYTARDEWLSYKKRYKLKEVEASEAAAIHIEKALQSADKGKFKDAQLLMSAALASYNEAYAAVDQQVQQLKAKEKEAEDWFYKGMNKLLEGEDDEGIAYLQKAKALGYLYIDELVLSMNTDLDEKSISRLKVGISNNNPLAQFVYGMYLIESEKSESVTNEGIKMLEASVRGGFRFVDIILMEVYQYYDPSKACDIAEKSLSIKYRIPEANKVKYNYLADC